MSDVSHLPTLSPTGAGPTGTGARDGIAPPRGFRDDHPWYLLTRRVVAATLDLLADVEVQGMEHCPPRGRGGLILASNHVSLVDIPLIGAWCPRTVIYFAKVEVQRWPVVGAIARAYGGIFVRRGEADRQAIRAALESLAAGQVLGMFPEGHRNHGTGLLRARPGVALLAARAGVPVWPLAVSGTERVGQALRPRITLTAGRAFDPVAAAREAHGPGASHQDVADTIMGRIAALLPEHQRGVYR